MNTGQLHPGQAAGPPTGAPAHMHTGTAGGPAVSGMEHPAAPRAPGAGGVAAGGAGGYSKAPSSSLGMIALGLTIFLVSAARLLAADGCGNGTWMSCRLPAGALLTGLLSHLLGVRTTLLCQCLHHVLVVLKQFWTRSVDAAVPRCTYTERRWLLCTGGVANHPHGCCWPHPGPGEGAAVVVHDCEACPCRAALSRNFAERRFDWHIAAGLAPVAQHSTSAYA
jgi:hypothetical protein